jgi:dolichol-phosphate mannosyltransferase
MDINITNTEKPLRAVVIVPTYNEAETLPTLLGRLCSPTVGVDVLVVDDASPDGTQEIVKRHAEFERRVFLLARNGKRGLASAYKAGFEWALARGYEVCLEMDADLSHDPLDVPRLLDSVRDGCDVAIGSRYVGGIRVINWPPARLLLSLFAGTYTRRLTGLPLSDPTSGFKAVHRRVLQSLDWGELRADGYAFQIELHYRAWKAGFALCEIPIIFTERRSGASKMSRRIAFEAAWRVLALGAERIVQFARKPASGPAGEPHRSRSR